MTLAGVGNYPGGRLVSHTEFLNSPNSSYHPNMDCRWTIFPPNNYTLIHLIIKHLDLEAGSGQFQVCRYDNLTFSFTNAINGRFEEFVVCNTMHSVKFTSSSNVSIRFVTDHSIAKRGFHLEWYLVPRGEASRLREWEDLKTASCPDWIHPSYRTGVLTLLRYQQNTHCNWRLTLRPQEIIVLKIKLLSLDSRDFGSILGGQSRDSVCGNARDQLTIQINDPIRGMIEKNFCGRQPEYVTSAVTIHNGEIRITFTSDDSDQGVGFSLFYRTNAPATLARPVHPLCPEFEQLNSHQSILSSMILTSTIRNCSWIVQPKDDGYLIKLTVVHFLEIPRAMFRPFHYFNQPHGNSYSECTSIIIWRANATVSESSLFRAASEAYVSRTDPIDSMRYSTSSARQVCATRRGMSYQPHFLIHGPIEIRLESNIGSGAVQVEIRIDHIPIVKLQSRNLCPNPRILSTKQVVYEKLPERRLVSFKKMAVSHTGDCRTSVKFKDNADFTSAFLITRGDTIRFSVKCTDSQGSLYAFVSGSLTQIWCNSFAILNWTNENNPVLLESDGTRGFNVTLDYIKYVYDGSLHCPSYNPTLSGAWIANLPYAFSNFDYNMRFTYSGQFSRHGIYYCEFPLSPPSNYELLVQLMLQTPWGAISQQEICSRLAQLNQQSQLNFILTTRDNETTMSLCDHDTAGSFDLEEKIRVPSGSVLQVDLIAARMIVLPDQRNDSRLFKAIMMSGINAMIIVNQVDPCQTLDAQAWTINKDHSELTNKVTIPINNTQTDCYLQLSGANAVLRAEGSNFRAASKGSEQCWNLELSLQNYKTTCGLEQLSIVTSYWDSLSNSITHRSKEICETTRFSYRVAFLKKDANETGISLYYSGVRSGFVAEYVLSACQDDYAKSLNVKWGDNNTPATHTNANYSRSPLTIAVVLLSLAIICTVLFAQRRNIIEKGRGIINRARGSHRLSYTTGNDGVSLVDDS